MFLNPRLPAVEPTSSADLFVGFCSETSHTQQHPQNLAHQRSHNVWWNRAGTFCEVNRQHDEEAWKVCYKYMVHPRRTQDHEMSIVHRIVDDAHPTQPQPQGTQQLKTKDCASEHKRLQMAKPRGFLLQRVLSGIGYRANDVFRFIIVVTSTTFVAEIARERSGAPRPRSAFL